MGSIGALFVTGASDGFRHWTFIFCALLRPCRPGSLCDGLGFREGLDTSPIVGYALVRAGVAVGQPVQRWLAIARIACTALPRDLNEAERDSLTEAWPDRMTVQAELDKVIVSARQEAVMLGLATVAIKLDLEAIEDLSS
jgi:hypothetical protein